MSIVRPYRYGKWDREHGETDDGKAGNREHKIAHQTMQHAEMLAAQRKTPLQQEQRKK
jgi:hypothetical protein